MIEEMKKMQMDGQPNLEDLEEIEDVEPEMPSDLESKPEPELKDESQLDSVPQLDSGVEPQKEIENKLESEKEPKMSSDSYLDMQPKKKSNIKKIIVAIAAVCIIAVGGYAAYVSNHSSASSLELKKEKFHVEFGEKVSKNPDTYLKGDTKAIKDAKVDLSNVKEKEVGEYDATITAGKQTLNFKIEISDTEGPKIKVNDNVKVLTNEPVSSTTIVESIKDASNLVDYTIDEEYIADQPETMDFSDGKIPEYTLKFPESGRITVTITATDSYLNTSKEKVQITVEDEPEIKGMDDMTVTVGEDVDWLKDLKYDEDEVKKITADDSEVDMDKAGEYTLKFSITMKSGQVYMKEVKVTVEDEATKAERDKKTADEQSQNKSQNNTSEAAAINSNQVSSTQQQPEDDEPYVGNSGHTFSSWEEAESYAQHRVETNYAKDFEISANGAGGFTVDFVY